MSAALGQDPLVVYTRLPPAPGRDLEAWCSTLPVDVSEMDVYHGVVNANVDQQLRQVVQMDLTAWSIVSPVFNVAGGPPYREFVLVGRYSLESLRRLMPSVPNVGYASDGYYPDFGHDQSWLVNMYHVLPGPPVLHRSAPIRPATPPPSPNPHAE